MTTAAPPPHTDEAGNPVGPPLPNWEPRALPPTTPMVGRLCRIEPLELDAHGQALTEEFLPTGTGHWTYLPYGPFDTEAEVHAWVKSFTWGPAMMQHAIVDLATNRAVGVAALMRTDVNAGAIETGAITYSPALQRTAMATEAMYLMMCRVFDELGYRRYEWKCDHFNAPSRSAALRLGFRFEGLFRNHKVYKGRSRDTAWFSITVDEWPGVKARLERWLDPGNFDQDGQQLTSL